MSEQIIKAIESLGSQVDTKYEQLKSDFTSRLEKAEQQAKESVDGVDAALKTEIKNMAEDINEMKKQSGKVAATDITPSVGDQIRKSVEANAQNLSGKKNFRFDVNDIHQKAAGSIMGSSANLTGTNFVEPRVINPWFMPLYEPQHIRDIIPVSSLGATDKLAYTQFKSQNSNVAKVAEGALKPLSDVSFEKKIVIVQKLAHHYRVPEEMMDDNEQLSTAITTIGLEELKKKEDYDLLFQSGAGLEFNGLTVEAQAFLDPTSTDLKQRYDVLVAAVTQSRKAKHRPNFILMNPSDVADMILTKDLEERYLFPDLIRTGAPNVLNVPIITHEDIAAGSFLMGNSSAARIWDRKGAEVRFHMEDQDNAVKNLITIVIEERLSMAVYYPDAFIFGSFATAIGSY